MSKKLPSSASSSRKSSSSPRKNVGANQGKSSPFSAGAAPLVVSPGAASSSMGEHWGASEEGEAPEVQAPKPIRRLASNVKRFLVIQNACGSSPSEVVKAVKSVFDADVSAALVECYDPTKTAGQSLSLPLKTLFREMQREFQTMAVKAGIADQKWRIAKLHLIAQHAFDRGNHKMAMDAMEQVAKDLGGVYTNKARLEVDDKKMLLAKLLRCAPEDLPGMKAAVDEAKGASETRH